MGIKMIVSDLDGTIVNSHEDQYEVSPKLIEEINEFQKNGRIFTIATGRPNETTIGVIKKLGIKSPYIVHNGAEIIDRHGKQIYAHTFSLKSWVEFLEGLQKIGASVVFSHDGQVFCLKHTESIRAYEKKELIECQVADKALLDSKLEVNKILIIGDIEKYKERWNQLDGDLKNQFRYVVSEDNYMEIVAKHVSKGNALKRLKEYLGLRDEEVVTIGNHLNDKELLEEAHVGCAVANAVDDLKTISEFVTEGKYEEGVIEVIKKFK
ncbi:hypothetical protein EAL2_808p00150 (plasmid) [Peptoclostridium acidaminophilum DSM 3953]|uniref:Cof-like hydrolase n=1 Tax=Peptoclostridium acidaminophilum DSM 3953 TaxID=1286171 RepID=W8TMU9_PEPAC|nr:Cof-type HAD-IIB family hydrolase [Peptoclostridium acidaminophilum]AHM57522.1 hypothetical protein EAL2_808p00150 [Peptoclostridium acidaminophilum DSM 3953]